jgi:predicted MPP superfamily phosphohydrolase
MPWLTPLLIKKLLFHGSYLVIPYMAWLSWRLYRRHHPWSTCFLLVLGMLFIWMRFVEPQWIRVRETTLAGTGIQADIVLISDLHLGVYKDTAFLERVVARIKQLPADRILIAGDFTYEPEDRPLDRMFEPLGRLERPVYAVLGNHDQQAPGPDIDRPLRVALERLGVAIVEQGVADAGHWRIAGLGDHWGGNDDPEFLARTPDRRPTLLLAHNPDSVMRVRPQDTVLALAGHTHCGQIRLPWLYRKMIPSTHGFDCGLETARTPRGDIRVFITAGLGEIGLPMRFLNPPAIDWLRLRP